METFGLLKILTSLLDKTSQSPLSPSSAPPSSDGAPRVNADEKEKNDFSFPSQERENAFVKLMERHRTQSKRIDEREKKR